METIVSQELDMNVLMDSPAGRTRGEHGWYTGGTHSYDGLLRSPVVKTWIDNYTSENTRDSKLRKFEKVFKASKLNDPADLLKLTDLEAKQLVKKVAQFYLQKGRGVTARHVMIAMQGFYEA